MAPAPASRAWWTYPARSPTFSRVAWSRRASMRTMGRSGDGLTSVPSIQVSILDVHHHGAVVGEALGGRRHGAGDGRAAGHGAVAGDARGGGDLAHAGAGHEMVE